MQKRSKNNGLIKLTTRISEPAMKLLQAECARRYRSEAARTPYGRVITELVTRHLGTDDPPKIPPATNVSRRLEKTA